ncbi:MAG: ATP-binding protein [Synergistaceae bacterium]|nr:ATP-binding protein [Synergistaceae bacterium]
MIDKVLFVNFGPLSSVKWSALGGLNLVIGENSAGKTFLLKALYSIVRSLELFGRGDERQTSLSDILAKKLHWTFQADKIGDLVSKGSRKPLSFEAVINNHKITFSFGKDTAKHISKVQYDGPSLEGNSVFLPAKEILSIHHIILKSREIDQLFGFDDTYFDLAKVLSIRPTKGKNFPEFAQSRENLRELLGGRMEYDETDHRWSFRKGNERYAPGITAEGVKKLAILDTLLGNRYLSPQSTVFIDEVEAALHPKAISAFLDILALLAEREIQFFIATHSYFVLKKLLLISQKKRISIPVLSANEGKWTAGDLIDGMPDNPIVDESVRLYEEQVELSFQ